MNEAVKRCSACGLYYNGRVYDGCPRCKAGQISGLVDKHMPSFAQKSMQCAAWDEPYRGRHSRNKTILIHSNGGERK